jgi:CHAT domain-containing protein
VELLSQRRFNVESAKLSSTTPDLRAIKQIAQQTNTTLVTYSLIRQVDRNYEMNRLFGWANVGYRFDQFLYIWVVAPDGNITFRQVPVTQVNLAELVSETRQAMGVRGSRSDVDIKVSSNLPQRRTETEARLAQLHKILIAPIADLLPTDPKQTVAFIPQGELFLVPFAALKAPNGSYLIENHTIVTAPSIQVLQLTHKLAKQRNRPARFQAKNPLIVGNPTMPRVPLRSAVGTFQSVQLDPLFGAQREAKRVADFLGTSALIGEQATEARVKQQMGSADVIHLATHGLLEYGDPRETGTLDVPGAIALTPGKGEDGLLTTAEILQMNLQANLVVLSACDTGRGRVTGDGVIGLSRAFVAAGVPSIVVSLWKVPDDSTAFLMTEFYKNLQKFPDKAQALRQAMLTARANYTDPLHWAAFTLIGEAR